MYIFKNAWRNITRRTGRNLLLGAILTTIVVCTTIALSIYEAGENLVKSYKKQNALRISLEANQMERKVTPSGEEKGEKRKQKKGRSFSPLVSNKKIIMITFIFLTEA